MLLSSNELVKMCVKSGIFHGLNGGVIARTLIERRPRFKSQPGLFCVEFPKTCILSQLMFLKLSLGMIECVVGSSIQIPLLFHYIKLFPEKALNFFSA